MAQSLLRWWRCFHASYHQHWITTWGRYGTDHCTPQVPEPWWWTIIERQIVSSSRRTSSGENFRRSLIITVVTPVHRKAQLDCLIIPVYSKTKLVQQKLELKAVFFNIWPLGAVKVAENTLNLIRLLWTKIYGNIYQCNLKSTQGNKLNPTLCCNRTDILSHCKHILLFHRMCSQTVAYTPNKHRALTFMWRS